MSRACKSLVLVLGCLLLAGCAETRTAPAPFTLAWLGDRQDQRFSGHEALTEKVRNSFVQITVLDPSAPKPGEAEYEGRPIVSGASGVIIDRRGYVVTAAHIARSTAFTAEVTTWDGTIHQARILDVDTQQELALLLMEPVPNLDAASLAVPGSLHKGDPVIAIGAPDNKPGVVSLGFVVEPRWPHRITYDSDQFGFDDGVKLSIDAEPGNSGGPAFDWQGGLIGILAGFVLGNESSVNYIPPRLAYLVPAATIRRYLTRLLPP